MERKKKRERCESNENGKKKKTAASKENLCNEYTPEI